MAKLRKADAPEPVEPEDVDALARLAHWFALRLNTDPPYPRPAWLSDAARAMSPADLLALIEEHDPGAVRRARETLAREKRERR